MNPLFSSHALLTLFALWLATPAGAAEVPHWQIDSSKSSLGFSGTQSGVAFQGQFEKFSASIGFDPAKLESSRIAVDIDIASATTGDVQRDAALPDKGWFDSAAFPHATFESVSISKTGDGYEAAGTLTIRGARHPLTLPFSLSIDGDVAKARGRATLNRTLFGIGQGSWSSGDVVGTDVTVDINITATRTP